MRSSHGFVSASILALSVIGLAGCAVEGQQGSEGEETVASSDQTLTTTQIFTATAIAKGASKTGLYTATASGRFTFATTGTGDADLYVKKGSAPTTASFGCKSDGGTAVESCGLDVVAGDKIYYLVVGYTASTVSLSVTTPDAIPGGGGTTGGDAGTPPARTTQTILPSSTFAAKAVKTGSFTASTAGSVTFDTAGTGDVDLLVNVGAAVAGVSTPTCRSEGNTSVEHCTVTLAAGQKAFFSVLGYAASSSAGLTVTSAGGSFVVDAAVDVNLAPVPADVQAYLTANHWGMMHLQWHTVRQWDRMSAAALSSAKLQGWTRSAIQEGQAGNGLQFLAMHRVMFRALKTQFPQYAGTIFNGWSSVPTNPRDPVNALPNGGTTAFSANMTTAIANLMSHPENFASDDAWGTYLETTFRPVPGNPTATSTDPSTGLHNYLHNRWTDNASPVTMGDPAVNLGNKMFWKLHGWIDEQWSAYRRAKGLSDTDLAYTTALHDAEMEMGMMDMSGMQMVHVAEPADVMPIRQMFMKQ
jgi:hypothetical protein